MFVGELWHGNRFDGPYFATPLGSLFEVSDEGAELSEELTQWREVDGYLLAPLASALREAPVYSYGPSGWHHDLMLAVSGRSPLAPLRNTASAVYSGLGRHVTLTLRCRRVTPGLLTMALQRALLRFSCPGYSRASIRPGHHYVGKATGEWALRIARAEGITAGEALDMLEPVGVISRLAKARLALTDDQRRLSPPADALDVPEELVYAYHQDNRKTQ